MRLIARKYGSIQSYQICRQENKHPRCRSAFTYCEDELPSHLDLGKHKYGEPFTTEQVEDSKHSYDCL